MRKITKYLFILLIIITIILITYLGYNQLQKPQLNENELLQLIKSNNYNIVEQIMLELTDDKYAGRINGTEGNLLATLYLVETFESIGLSKWDANSYEHPYYDNASNVVGVIEGKDKTKAIVITAHFDGIFNEGESFTQGALDNASGVAAMLRIATNLLELEEQPETDILFVAFNEEEIGLKGSAAFVPKVQEYYSEIYNINIDSIGLKDVSYMFNLTNSMGEHSKVLNQELLEVFSEHGIPYMEYSFGVMSDNRSFLINNITSMPITQDVEIIKEIFHTQKDVIDIIDIANIEKVADSITEFIIISKGKMY